jgi:hypothetical protein
MNGDGESSDVSGVDGQNITPSAITTGAITSTSLNTVNIVATGNIDVPTGYVDCDLVNCDDIQSSGLADLQDLIVQGTTQLIGTTTAALIQAADIDLSNNIQALGVGATNGFFVNLAFESAGRVPSDRKSTV